MGRRPLFARAQQGTPSRHRLRLGSLRTHRSRREFQSRQGRFCPVFDPSSHFQTTTFVKTVKDIQSLELAWVIPDQEPLYESKVRSASLSRRISRSDLVFHPILQPASFLSHYIGHEGPGSILSYLKKKGWVNSLSAGPSEGANGWGFLRISCDLTPEGLGTSWPAPNPFPSLLLIFSPSNCRKLRSYLDRHLLLSRSSRQVWFPTRRVPGGSVSRRAQLSVRREVLLTLRLCLRPRRCALWTLAEGVDAQPALVDA